MNRIIFIVVALMLPGAFALAGNVPADWAKEWPRTDFSTATVNFSEILSGGPPKDGIPAIDKPKFIPVADVANLAGTEPVIAFSLNGKPGPIRSVS